MGTGKVTKERLPNKPSLLLLIRLVLAYFVIEDTLYRGAETFHLGALAGKSWVFLTADYVGNHSSLYSPLHQTGWAFASVSDLFQVTVYRGPGPLLSLLSGYPARTRTRRARATLHCFHRSFVQETFCTKGHPALKLHPCL